VREEGKLSLQIEWGMRRRRRGEHSSTAAEQPQQKPEKREKSVGLLMVRPTKEVYLQTTRNWNSTTVSQKMEGSDGRIIDKICDYSEKTEIKPLLKEYMKR
jgi:hypothetical protein